MTKLYIIGICILLIAIIANTIANYINITTWYNFYNTILEKESLLKAIQSQSVFNLFWLFFIYPFILGTAYLIGEELFNIFP